MTIDLPGSVRRAAALEPPVHGCANCGAPAPETHCPACGQNTRERLPTFGQFMREATGRYIAYDGKFWKTLAALLLRPGFLTREYLAGRRRRYTGPARLFLVSSLFLFATLRFTTESISLDQAVESDAAKTPAKIGAVEPKKGESAQSETGDAETKRAKIGPVEFADAGETIRPGELITFDDKLNLNLRELSGTTGILRKPIARFNSLSRAQKIDQITVGALRYGPYAMFALLPAIALLLKILYFGRGRRYPERPRLYGEHLVFAAHNHAFLFVAGSLLAILPRSSFSTVLIAWMFVYLAWSARAVYRGAWIGLFSRALVLGFAYLILFAFVTVGLIVAAVLLR